MGSVFPEKNWSFGELGAITLELFCDLEFLVMKAGLCL